MQETNPLIGAILFLLVQVAWLGPIVGFLWASIDWRAEDY